MVFFFQAAVSKAVIWSTEMILTIHSVGGTSGSTCTLSSSKWFFFFRATFPHLIVSTWLCLLLLQDKKSYTALQGSNSVHLLSTVLHHSFEVLFSLYAMFTFTTVHYISEGNVVYSVNEYFYTLLLPQYRTLNTSSTAVYCHGMYISYILVNLAKVPVKTVPTCL